MHDLPQADHVLDEAKRVQFKRAHGGTPIHRGLNIRIHAEEHLAGLEPAEEVRDVLRLSRGLERERYPLDERPDEFQRLLERAVEEPGVPWPDPPDCFGATPLSRSHMHASMPVFPAPITVYPLPGSLRVTRSLIGISRTFASTPNDGV